MQTFKLSFDVNILAFFGLATVLATLSKIWATFAQSSGHLDYCPCRGRIKLDIFNKKQHLKVFPCIFVNNFAVIIITFCR
jgi:hypothetical protein